MNTLIDPNSTLHWLSSGPSWVQYRTLLDLKHQPETDQEVKLARAVMVHDEQIHALILDIEKWNDVVLKRHNDASHPLHELAFIAEIGLDQKDPQISSLLSQILSHQSPEGPFEVLMNVSETFGGSGQDQWTWVLCDAPLLLYSLVKMGLGNDERVQKAIQSLTALGRENGWPCAASASMGKFHGPGRREDPCPYSNLLMLKLLASIGDLENPKALSGIEIILALWENSQTKWPYLFHMGTNFRKLKIPFIWYGILHVCEVLSEFPHVHSDPRFIEMSTLIKNKSNSKGQFTPESIWTKWKGWEFTQKKEPSYWLTFLILRIEKRLSVK